MVIRALVRDLQLTIVKKYDVYPGYQLDCLTTEAKEKFSLALRPGKQWLQRHEQICKLFECFLYLCEAVVTTHSFRTEVFRELALRFIGALNSEKFILATSQKRLILTRAFLVLLGELGIFFPELRWRRGQGFGADMIPIVQLFEDMELNLDRVWVFGAWWTTNLRGEGILLPLFPVYKRFGRAFAETMYEACNAHISVRGGALPTAFKSLCNFIGQHPTLKERDLKDSVIAASFWRDLLVQHSLESHTGPKSTTAASIVTSWNNNFIPMVRSCLVPTGFFAIPLGDFPHPPARRVPGGSRRVRTRADGTEVKRKLITDIPLKLTDHEAAKILFFNIERDRDLIVQWAEYQADSIETKLEGRDRFAYFGTPRTVQTSYTPGDKRKFLTSHENPKVFFNAVATFQLHGFSPSTSSRNTLLYPSPITDVAVMLALPTAGSEIPLLAILIAEHPCITPSVLESLLLFDSSGMGAGVHQ